MSTIGYGSSKKTKLMLLNAFHKFLVHNIAELEMLMMHSRGYCAEIVHNFFFRNRGYILNHTAQLDIKATNPGARVKVEEAK